MKKNLIAAGCIFLLAVIALPVSVYYIDQGKNAIVITQEVIEGSPEAASGIVLHMENTWNHNLFWETEYVIRSGEPAKSHFTFYAGQSKGSPYIHTEFVRLRNSLAYFYGSGYGAQGLNPDAVPVPETVREMVHQANPREAVVAVMPVRDLYEYWPISVEVSNDSHKLFYIQEYGMPEFFQIPIPEGAMAEITVQKDADDRCTLLKCDAKDGVIDIKSSGAFGTEGCYLAYYCVDARSGDLMPPGEDYGIYYMPYHPEGAKEIQKIFSLEKDCMPLALEADGKTGQLWVLILQNGSYYLDLLDVKEERERTGEMYCQLVQQITVLDTGTTAAVDVEGNTGTEREAGAEKINDAEGINGAERINGTERIDGTERINGTEGINGMEGIDGAEGINGMEGINGTEGIDGTEGINGMEKNSFSLARMTLVPVGVLLTWQEDGLFAFISEDPEDGYTLWCVDHFPAGKGSAENTLFPSEQAFLFDGERLTLAAFPDFMSNNVQLAVFTKEGLAYYGLYRHSGEWDRENDMPGGWIHPVGVIDSGEIRRTKIPLRLWFP